MDHGPLSNTMCRWTADSYSPSGIKIIRTL